MARTPSSLANRTRAVLALAFAWLTALAALDGFVNVRFSALEAEATLRPVRQARPILAVVATLADDDERHVTTDAPPALPLTGGPAKPAATLLAGADTDIGRHAAARPSPAHRPTGPPAA